ncbi:drug/metabolite transporter (DMT)-like permease [Sagittula marina]|uniref:Drug/metabolite transporter (DMT)-like permease n=1 Tax=Sagittula marina TaxID=943940 RepID=A0A7W6DL01_9RHOB|nr:DMT family transporter [Sagittula marina]MBB3984908.1 drug/metabolite transporter (DMT)-like permease [Sagittula marina]
MELWIIATLSAAVFQTVRFMLQKVLAGGRLSATGSTFARFAYAAPAAAVLLLGYVWITQAALPSITPDFWVWAIFGGLGQILATVLVVLAFRERNFAVGITLKKTEVIQTALLGLILLGEVISLPGWIGIGIGLIGVLLLSRTPGIDGALWTQLRSRVVLLGVGSGFFFAVAGVGYRAATLQVGSDDPVLRALIGLVFVTIGQALGMAAWLRWRAPGEITRVWQARRTAVWLGLTSAFGTMSWFTAFTLQTAAYVYAVGQVELVLSLAASVLWFKEKVTAREVAGIAVLTVSVVILVLVA